MDRRTDKQKLFIGIDIAKAAHVAQCITASSRKKGKSFPFAQNKEGLTSLVSWIENCGTPETVVIGMEATGQYWKILYLWLSEKGWLVELINPIVTARQAKRSIRGRKTDPDDAYYIAKCVRDADYQPSQIPSYAISELQTLTRARADLVVQRSTTKIHINGTLDILFPEWKDVSKKCTSRGFIALLSEAPSAAKIAAKRIDRITTLIQKASCGHWKRTKAIEIRSCAQRSIGIASPAQEAILLIFISLLKTYDARIDDLDTAIEKQMETIESPLRHVPHAGPVSLATLIAEFGCIDRFTTPVLTRNGMLSSNPGQMLAFAGLEPRMRSSGAWVGREKMSKRGSGALRSAILCIADFARRGNVYFQQIFDKHKKRGKAHYVCLSHVARKYIHGIHALLTHPDTFEWDIFMGIKDEIKQTAAKNS